MSILIKTIVHHEYKRCTDSMDSSSSNASGIIRNSTITRPFPQWLYSYS